jgi:hypothetical protein
MKKKTTKPYNLLVYVEDSNTRIKRFETELEMGEFVDNFYKTYPNYAELYSDNWVDHAITGVTGEVHFFTDGLEVE